MESQGQESSRFDAARRGERWAEEEIHALIEGFARHACSRSGPRLAADLAWEDVAQEASVNFFSVGLSQYGGQGSEESYLYTLVKTTLLQRVRGADRRKKREELSVSFQRVALPASFDRLEVDSILALLDEICRELLRQSFLSDTPYPQLAARMGLAESSVRAKVSRCLRRARELAA
jgi:RNA polymerase sigma factor (sigma-70 family)